MKKGGFMQAPIFNKDFFANSEGSFWQEFLVTGIGGNYCSSSIANCNTRKYHGVFVCRQPAIDQNDHLIVANIDEQVTYKDKQYLLSNHKYPFVVYPKGYEYITSFRADPMPRWTYQLGDCMITKEVLIPSNDERTLIRYEVTDGEGAVELQLQPLLGFRQVHGLSVAEGPSNKKIELVNNGFRVAGNAKYAPTYIQTSLKSGVTVAPDHYYNIEYPREQERGYPDKEDLFTPGYIKVVLRKGQKLVLSIGLSECNTKLLANLFNTAKAKLPVFDSFFSQLSFAASQFLERVQGQLRVRAGFHWFGVWGRDTFISLPGLLLSTGRKVEFLEVLSASFKDIKNGLVPNVGTGSSAAYNSVDSSLWLIWALQQYAIDQKPSPHIWPEYGAVLSNILNEYRNGTLYGIKMESDGLITAGEPGKALTWMDAVVDGVPVTPRMGKAVEVNALWYNAVCFCLEQAMIAGDESFVAQWRTMPELIKNSFSAVFHNEGLPGLADFVYNENADLSVRPNQVFAVSLPYSPLSNDQKRSVLQSIRSELLTTVGLRTLAPSHVMYKGTCEGDQPTRDRAYHQGTIWPWLTGHYAYALYNTYGAASLHQLIELRDSYRALIGQPCLNTIPEIYNADAPHKPVGAIAQAWSVAELLRLEELVQKLEGNNIIN